MLYETGKLVLFVLISILAAISVPYVARESFLRFSNPAPVRISSLQDIFSIWFIYSWAGALSIMVGGPPLSSVLYRQKVVMPLMIGTAIVGLIRLFVITHRNLIPNAANTVIMWMPACVGGITFLSLYSPKLIARIFTDICYATKFELQTTSLFLLVGGLIILSVVEVIGVCLYEE